MITGYSLPTPAFTVRYFGRSQDASAVMGRTSVVLLTAPAPFSYVRAQLCNSALTTKLIDRVYAQTTREAFGDASNQTVTSAAPIAGGTGYAVNDAITLAGGTSATAAVATVVTIGAGGAVTRAIISTPGAYSAPPSGAVSQASSSGAGTGAIFTLTTRNGPSFAPVDSTGAALSFVPLYFNAAGADSDPGATTGTTASITIAAAASTAAPVCIWSDWAQITGATRLDGGSRPYLQVRVYTSGSVSWQAKDAYANDDPSINLGQIWSSYDVGGDQSTASPGVFGAVGRYALNAVQFIGIMRSTTVMACGDSLTQGHQKAIAVSTALPSGVPSGDYYSWGHIAVQNVTTATRPVVWYSSGWTAQTTAQFYARCIADVARIKPNIVFIAPYSPNDVQTMAQAQAGFGLAVALAQKVVANGGRPIFWTPMPVNGKTTGSQDDARMWVVNRVKASGYPYFDADAIVSNGAYQASSGATPSIIQPIYDSGDGLHMNDAGYQAMALGTSSVSGAAAVLSRVLGN